MFGELLFADIPFAAEIVENETGLWTLIPKSESVWLSIPTQLEEFNNGS